MDEEPIEEQPFGLNPDPEVLRKENAEDALLAQGQHRDEQIDKMIEQANNPPEVEQLDVNEFLEDVDAGDPKEVGEQQDVKEAMQQPAPAPPRAPAPTPGKLPGGQGVDPKAIQDARRARHAKQPQQQPQKIPTPEVAPAQAEPQKAPEPAPGFDELAARVDAWGVWNKANPLPPPKVANEPVQAEPVVEKAPEPEPKEMPEPVVPQPAKAEEPGLIDQALAWAVKRAAELAQPLPLPKEVERPLGGPDNREEPMAVDQAINPLGNDKDLDNRILDMLRQYLDQERAYKNGLFNILSEALNMLRSDHVRLENLEAAFERDREAY